MEAPSRVKVLCVDDEPNVLEGITLHLRRRFDVLTAASGELGLELLARDPAIAVVMSDMRMPGMDGAEFLKNVRQARPDTVRLLLTGYADLESAIAAVNDGQIFRFLTKPCPPATLLVAVNAAAEQHRLVTAERVLLEQTLRGAIKTLVNVLALTNPASFGRASRVKSLALELADRFEIAETWPLEVAALLSQIGYIVLPGEVAEKVYYATPLSESEQKMVKRVPEITEQLLGNIPRLEVVREIMAGAAKPAQRSAPAPGSTAHLARILQVALDFDLLETQGCTQQVAVETLRGHPERYDASVLEALSALRGAEGAREAVRDIPLAGLRPGMIIAADVKMAGGGLFVARGYEVTQSFVERTLNIRRGTVIEPIRVIVPTASKDDGAPQA